MKEDSASDTERKRFKIAKCRFCGLEISSSHLSRHWKECADAPHIDGNTICVTCQETKPIEEFPRNRTHVGGFGHTCRTQGLGSFRDDPLLLLEAIEYLNRHYRSELASSAHL
jgi:hypothetical protein